MSLRLFRALAMAALLVVLSLAFTGLAASAQTTTPPPDNVTAERVPSETDPNGFVIQVSWDPIINNSADVQAILDWLAGNTAPPNLGAADFNLDNTTTLDEALALAQIEVVDYVVKYRPVGEGDSAVFETVTDTVATISGLSDDPFEIAVRARFAGGSKSDWTAWLEVPAVNVPEPEVSGGADSLCETGGAIHDKILASGDYNESRVPLESQVWFFPTERSEGGDSTGHSFGHAHMLTCVPFPIAAGGEAVTTSTLDLDIESIVHFGAAHDLAGNPMVEPDDSVQIFVREIEIRGLNDSGADVLVGEFFADDDSRCQKRGLGAPVADCQFFTVCDASVEDTCKTNNSIELDLVSDDPKEGFPSDGFKQLRIAVVHEVVVNGEHVAVMRAIGRAPFNLAIGGNDRRPGINADPAKNITESSGWLIEQDRDGAGGYATAGFSWATSDSDNRALSATEPVVAGETFTLDTRFEADPCGANCAVRKMPITDYGVFLDPGFHAGACQCALISSFAGDPDIPVDATTFDPDMFTIRIPADTAPGPHKLVLAVEQPMVSGYNYWNRDAMETNEPWPVPREWSSTLNGLLVIHFVVAPAG